MSKTDTDKDAARVADELKQTEDLLAGFDRPARTPRTPAVNQDFVDFHLRRGSDPEPRLAAAAPKAPDPKRVEATFLIRRTEFPKWKLWAALLVVMPICGVLVTYCALKRDDNGVSAAASTTQMPSAATTISAASSPAMQPTTGPERDIPPPPPPAEEPSFASSTTPAPPSPSQASASSKRAAAPTASSSSPRPRSSPSAAPASTVPPNPDFIRNL